MKDPGTWGARNAGTRSPRKCHGAPRRTDREPPFCSGSEMTSCRPEVLDVLGCQGLRTGPGPGGSAQGSLISVGLLAPIRMAKALHRGASKGQRPSFCNFLAR